MKAAELIDLALSHAREISAAVRRRILRALSRNRRDPRAAMRAVRAELRRISPILAAGIRDGQLLGWLTASQVVAAEAGIEPLAEPPIEPPEVQPAPAPAPEPRVRFPQIEAAAQWLEAAEIVPLGSQKAVVDDSRAIAFHVADNAIREADESIQAAIAKSITTGGTLKDFRDEVGAAIDQSKVGEWAVENIYRTGVGRAYSAGQLATLEHPMVDDEFPYVAYYATHDARTEDTHLALETMGLDGTNIYRRDDPTIIKFWPPWRWACRCHAVPISLEDAAGYGVSEAIAWLESGTPPATPKHVQTPPFDLPKGWVPVSAGRLDLWE